MAELPQHVAIVMDGNGRWATKRHLPRVAGHRAGEAVIDHLVQYCDQIGIRILTLFAFGLDNLQRPPEEVGFLMDLMQESILKHKDRLHKKNIQLRVIGERSYLGDSLRCHIEQVEALTRKNTGLILVIAIHYSGHWDIAQAIKKITLLGRAEAERSWVEILSHVQENLCLSDLPNPDLLIRTSGEQRISNFMLWQLAYSELYFTDCHWPDFTVAEFEKALAFYQQRQRRFGLTPQQVENS